MFSSIDKGTGTRRAGEGGELPPSGTQALEIRHIEQPPARRAAQSEVCWNPYAPPESLSDERFPPGFVERELTRLATQATVLIERSRGTATTKFVAGFALCEGGAGAVLWSLYLQYVEGALSIVDHPQLLFMGTALGIALFHAGVECGVILAHRAVTHVRRSSQEPTEP